MYANNKPDFNRYREGDIYLHFLFFLGSIRCDTVCEIPTITGPLITPEACTVFQYVIFTLHIFFDNGMPNMWLYEVAQPFVYNYN